MGLILITHDLRVAFSMLRPDLRALRGLAARGRAGAARSSASRSTRTRSGLLLSEPPVDRRLAAARRRSRARCRPGRGRRTLRVRAALRVGGAGVPRGARRRCARVGGGRLDRPASASTRSRERDGASARDGQRSERVTPAVEAAETALVSRATTLTQGLRRRRGSAARSVTRSRASRSSSAPARASGSSASRARARRRSARCLVGLETPTSGRIAIDGIDATDYAARSTPRPRGGCARACRSSSRIRTRR